MLQGVIRGLGIGQCQGDLALHFLPNCVLVLKANRGCGKSKIPREDLFMANVNTFGRFCSEMEPLSLRVATQRHP